MGELLKIYGKIKIKGKDVNVELNNPINENTGGIIHIQGEQFRLEMSQLEFYRLVGCVNLAKENLKRMKGNLIDE